MKRLITIFLILMMTLISVSCNSSDTTEESVPEFNPAETEFTTKPENVDLGDYSVTYSGAIKYNPYTDNESKPTVVMYFNFKNNSKKPVKASDVLTITAKQGSKALKLFEYPNEYASIEQLNLHSECKAGKSYAISYCFEFNENGDDITYEVKTKNNTSKNKSTGKIIISKLDLVTVNLCIDSATEIPSE